MSSPSELLGLIGVLTVLGFWMEQPFAWAAKVGGHHAVGTPAGLGSVFAMKRTLG